MRHLRAIAALLLALASTGAANSADMPIKAAAVDSPNWTGFYLGGNAGGAWGKFDPTTTAGTGLGPFAYFSIGQNVATVDAAGAQSIKPFGFTGGFEGGYNRQWGQIVSGLEADVESINVRGSTLNGPVAYPIGGGAFNIASSTSANWLATVRARLGVATGNWLFFGTAGAAVTRIRGTFNFSDGAVAETSTVSSVKTGYAVGGGVEGALSQHWTVKAEYLYVRFGGTASSTVCFGFTFIITQLPCAPGILGNPTPLTHSVNGFSADFLRLGLNYRF